MNEYIGKINNDSLLIFDTKFLTEVNKNKLINEGYKLLIYDTKSEISNFQSLKESYEENNNNIYIHYTLIENDPIKILNEINILKMKLSEWDYKISKNNEYRDIGFPLPYNPQSIYDRNQPLRNKINELEKLIN